MARSRGAAAPAFVAPPGGPPAASQAPIAPWPLIDRYPIVIGANLTLQYISSVLRLCTTGYRREYVDCLTELLERDGHAFALCSGRVQALAQGRIALTPALLPPGHPDEAEALQVSDQCQFLLDRIPGWQQALSNLAWAFFHGVSCNEISWQLDSVPVLGGAAYRQMWTPGSLHFVHSRRIAYPDSETWEPHIWDQGMVRGWTQPGFGFEPTSTGSGDFGAAIADFPGKFILHAPQYRADYPTREGLGRTLIWLMAFKVMGLRNNAALVERFAKVWAWVTYATQSDGHPRAADEPDVAKAQAMMQAMGIGTLAGAVVPDSINLHVDGPAMKNQEGVKMLPSWIDLCNDEETKIVRGSTFTTSPGKFGTKGTSTAGKETEEEGQKFDAVCLAETLRRDLVTWIVRLNYPGREHLTPQVALHLDKPDPAARLAMAVQAAASGVAVDSDKIGAEVGLPVVGKGDKEGRVMAPVSPVTLSSLLQGAAKMQELALAAPAALGPDGKPLAPPKPGDPKPGEKTDDASKDEDDQDTDA